jgi:hypothetical protein
VLHAQPRAAGDDGRQEVLAVADAHAAGEPEHGAVEQGLVALADLAQAVEEVGPVAHVDRVDLGEFLEVLRVVAVVRQGVVALGDAELRVDAAGQLGADDVGDHAGGIGLEGQRDQVVHQLGVVVVEEAGHALGLGHHRVLVPLEPDPVGLGFGLGPVRPFDAALELLLELADGVVVLVEPLAVGGADAPSRRLASSRTRSSTLRRRRNSIACCVFASASSGLNRRLNSTCGSFSAASGTPCWFQAIVASGCSP